MILRNQHPDPLCTNIQNYGRAGELAFQDHTVTALGARGDRYIRPFSNRYVTDDIVGNILYVDYVASEPLIKFENVREIWQSGSQHAYKITGRYVALWINYGATVTFNQVGLYDVDTWQWLLNHYPNKPNITVTNQPLVI